MKKALLAALCFILVSLVLVNGTFALPDWKEVFQSVAALVEDGIPEQGGTAVHVELVSNDGATRLFPGGAVSRVSHVKNLGDGNVYFRLVYAVQYVEESWNDLTIRFAAGAGFEESGWIDTTSSGRPYRMKVFTYTGELPAGTSSPEVSISIAMDADVTSEQLARYSDDFLQMQALAIDPAPFAEKGYATAKAALDAALPLNSLKPF